MSTTYQKRRKKRLARIAESIARKAAKKAAKAGQPVASNEAQQRPVRWSLERQALADMDKAALAHLRDI